MIAEMTAYARLPLINPICRYQIVLKNDTVIKNAAEAHKALVARLSMVQVLNGSWVRLALVVEIEIAVRKKEKQKKADRVEKTIACIASKLG